MTDPRSHWDQVFSSKASDQVSWYQAYPALSLQMMAAAGAGPHSRIIDVGCGASRLIDCLLEQGIGQVTALDVSGAALQVLRLRLGQQAARLTWIEGDITRVELPQEGYDIWHDRAVFHFLGTAQQRQRYRAALHRALKPGGTAILATFAPDGPPRCSGLDVCRYDARGVLAELGDAFELLEEQRELHTTPGGAQQAFVYGRFSKKAI